MSRQGSIHGRAYYTEVVLLFYHELLQRLHRCLFLSSFWIYQIFRVVVGTACSIFRCVNWWISAALLFGETKIDQVDEVGLVRVVANDDIGWLEISMDVAL